MPDISALLEEVVGRIVEAVHPDRVILFGSYARGDADENSDVDLLVIAPSDAPRWKRTKPILKALRGLLFAKDVVWYTPDEMERWAEEPAHFVSTVLREGRVLYAATAGTP